MANKNRKETSWEVSMTTANPNNIERSKNEVRAVMVNNVGIELLSELAPAKDLFNVQLCSNVLSLKFEILTS